MTDSSSTWDGHARAELQDRDKARAYLRAAIEAHRRDSDTEALRLAFSRVLDARGKESPDELRAAIQEGLDRGPTVDREAVFSQLEAKYNAEA